MRTAMTDGFSLPLNANDFQSIPDRLSFLESARTLFLSPERKKGLAFASPAPSFASPAPSLSSPITPENAKPFFLAGGRHAVLLLHGFTGSPSHMRLIGEGLNKAGFTVRGIALKGHNATIEDMMHATWHDWLEDARKACAELLSEYERVSVAGLSMGGVLSLILAEEYANNADHALTACIPIEAPMNTTNRFRHLSLLAAPFMPVMNKRADGSRDTLDKAYDYGYNQIPTAKTHDLNVLMARAKRDLPLVTCPVLAIQSHGDKTVSADSLDTILRGISSEKKASLWLDSAPHVATISPEKDKIIRAMTEFLNEAER